jgi:hypothetical protein
MRIEDHLMATKTVQPNRSLSDVEASVWLEIGRLRREKDIDARAFPLRAAAVAAALGLGALVGGVQGARAGGERAEISAFQVSLALAPSTLLGER